MALSLRDVRCDPIASRALAELMHDYTVAEEESRLVLTKKSGTLQLFLQRSTTCINGISSSTEKC